MTVVTDPKTGVSAHVTECRSCQAPVYWGFTTKGKRCPMNVVDGEATDVSHFTTCNDPKRWSKKA